MVFDNQRGALTLGGLIFLLIIAAAVYVGIKMSVPLIKNQQVKELFRTKVARLKVESEDLIRQETYEKLKELNVILYVNEEVEDDGLHITIEEGKPALMEAIFFEEVHFIGGYKYTYRFNPKMESAVIVNPQ